jgi:hypothetical protein
MSRAQGLALAAALMLLVAIGVFLLIGTRHKPETAIDTPSRTPVTVPPTPGNAPPFPAPAVGSAHPAVGEPPLGTPAFPPPPGAPAQPSRPPPNPDPPLSPVEVQAQKARAVQMTDSEIKALEAEQESAVRAGDGAKAQQLGVRLQRLRSRHAQLTTEAGGEAR